VYFNDVLQGIDQTTYSFPNSNAPPKVQHVDDRVAKQKTPLDFYEVDVHKFSKRSIVLPKGNRAQALHKNKLAEF